ncbi:MAG: tetratricopeptide repeat protein [Acidobacteriota bacterium]|nr:tetratricopeptide repeat protein [Blastocatellia bacterium]MDW8411069.1 tetratricopeptide repeat protein [Acidobacteriota bacterium]
MPNQEEAIREGLKHLSDIVEGKITLQELSGLSDEDVNAILALGALMYQQGRRAEAEDLFRGAVLLNRKNALAQSALGTVLTAEGKHDEALEALNAALELNPSDIAALVNRAEVHLKRAEFKEASEDLKRAIALDPEGTDPAANRARAIMVGMSELVKEIQKQIEQDQSGQA